MVKLIQRKFKRLNIHRHWKDGAIVARLNTKPVNVLQGRKAHLWCCLLPKRHLVSLSTVVHLYHYQFLKINIYPCKVIKYTNQWWIVNQAKIHSPKEWHNPWWARLTVLQQDIEMICEHPLACFQVGGFFLPLTIRENVGFGFGELDLTHSSGSKWIAGPLDLYSEMPAIIICMRCWGPSVFCRGCLWEE